MVLPPSGEKKSPNEGAKTDEKSLFEWWLLVIGALSSVAVAAFTGYLYNSTEKLWKESKRASDTAEAAARAAKDSIDSYRLAERAWVACANPVFMHFTDNIDPVTGQKGPATVFHIEWKNAGRTPAIDCQMYIAMKVSAEKGIPIFVVSNRDKVGRGAPLLPGVQIGGMRNTLTQKDIEALKNRKVRIFLHGRAEYGTVFAGDTRKYTDVCLEVNYVGGDKSGKTLLSFEHIGQQNCAT
jgi:hypothetical protein